VFDNAIAKPVTDTVIITIDSAIAKAHHTFARPRPSGEMLPSQS
jgi:hypothetical protein